MGTQLREDIQGMSAAAFLGLTRQVMQEKEQEARDAGARGTEMLLAMLEAELELGGEEADRVEKTEAPSPRTQQWRLLRRQMRRLSFSGLFSMAARKC